MLRTRLFEERGFRRFRCKVCGGYFWSLKERDTCGDAPCTAYEFIGDSPVGVSLENIAEVRERFLSFFERNGHTRISKYPVVAARWRTDVYLVGASIYVFQPWVTEGVVPPPANPLVISQPCIRMTDIDIVGRSGRHLTSFEMMAHHAFNYPDREVYWIDETVELAHRFFTEELKIPEEELTYKESTWSGGGNAGECFEVLVRGLEVATLVFMHYRTSPSGELVEMPIKVIDTGYGLERIYWLARGDPNIYEAVYGTVLDKIRERLGLERPDTKLLGELSRIFSKYSSEELTGRDLFKRVSKQVGIEESELRRIMVELEFLYSLPDHVRSFALMVHDGVLPSNSGIGYLARLVARRLLKYTQLLGTDLALSELAQPCLLYLESIYPEVREVREVVLELLDQEESKFRESIKNARSYISRTLKKRADRKRLTVDDLVLLYDAYGVPPEIVERICSEVGVEVEVPANFYALLVERKQRETGAKSGSMEQHGAIIGLGEVSSLPSTRELFYEDQYRTEFTARILRVYSKGDKYYVILDETCFYPEGGGQPHDTGTMTLPDGATCRVLQVQRVGKVIVHEVVCSREPREGETVYCRVDWERRYSLMRMHTGTHILLQALRRVLGPHVWQAGAQKSIPVSRLDITHYKLLSPDEVRRVEDLVNKIVEEGWRVETEELVRTEAERRYGVRIYQGGFIPAPVLRIVKIVRDSEIFDVQACGGTHLRDTREVGVLKIVGVERLQEGVIRVYFTTGRHVLDYVRSLEDEIRRCSEILSCSPSEVPERVAKLSEELRNLEQTLRSYERRLVEYLYREASQNIVRVGSADVSIVEIEEVSDKLLQDLARRFTSAQGRVIVFISKRRDVINVRLYSSNDVAKILPMKEVVKKMCEGVEDCKGGGSLTFAQASMRGAYNIEHLKRVILNILSSKLGSVS